MAESAFAGIKVADFAWAGVGPITAKYLADNGATVVRVESRSRVDVVRAGGPWKDAKPGYNRSQFFASFNTSKLGITLNLNAEEGRALAHRLCLWADVVVENFTPGVMHRWGIGYEDLQAENPSLVMLSTCQQGQTGPYASYPGYGYLGAALSGLYEIAGYPDLPPTPPYGAYTDFIAPRFCATALIAALDYRHRTGRGQHIDVAQVETALHFNTIALLEYAANGRVMSRSGNRDSVCAPHGVYKCRGHERYVAMACDGDVQWRSLCRYATAAPFGEDSRFRTALGRHDNAEELDRMIGEWTGALDAGELAEQLQRDGVPAAVVASCDDLHRDARLLRWEMFQYLEHKEMGSTPNEGPQFHLSRTPPRLRRAAPVMGQDNRQVYTEILGLKEAEIVELIERKVIY